MVNDPTSLNNLKTKVEDLDVAKLKTVPRDSNKLSDLDKSMLLKTQTFTHWKRNQMKYIR